VLFLKLINTGILEGAKRLNQVENFQSEYIKGFSNNQVSSLKHFHKSIRAILTVRIIFDFVKLNPIAMWMISFFEDISDLVIDDIDWRVSLVEQIFQWIVDGIDTLIDDVKITIDFVEEFQRDLDEVLFCIT
jgi:hypothetical protein